MINIRVKLSLQRTRVYSGLRTVGWRPKRLEDGTTNCLHSSNRDRTTRITQPVGRADGHPSRARTSTVVVRHDGQLVHVVVRHAVRSSHVTLSTLDSRRYSVTVVVTSCCRNTMSPCRITTTQCSLLKTTSFHHDSTKYAAGLQP